MKQLNLFEEYENSLKDELLAKAALDLLAAVNDGMKVKYEPHYYFQEGKLIVLIAVNKFKDSIYNILDLDGKIPDGLSACWRNLAHIQQDLQKQNNN